MDELLKEIRGLRAQLEAAMTRIAELHARLRVLRAGIDPAKGRNPSTPAALAQERLRGWLTGP